MSLGSVANYVYDADGNRYSVSNVGTTTSYVVDTSLPYASVVEEYSNGTLAARYYYGDDLVRMDRGTGVYYYIYDGLGSTRQLVNTSGAVTDTWGYTAFGELASHTGSTLNPFLFNAQQFDGANGDYYLRARYYDQSNGRFISQDPFEGNEEDPTTLHQYVYASNDPADRIDPGGEFDFTLIGLGITLAVGQVSDTFQNSGTLRGGGYAYSQLLGTGGATASSYLTSGGVIAATSTAATGGAATLAAVEVGSGVGYYAVGAIFAASTVALTNAANSGGSDNGPEDEEQKRRIPSYTISLSSGIPFYNSVKSSIFPETARHIYDAILGGQPSFLNYDPDKKRTRRRRDQSTALLAEDYPTRERDEYPFASTFQGGTDLNTPDVRYVTPRDNKNQGNGLKQFYNKVLKRRLGAPFYVLVIP